MNSATQVYRVTVCANATKATVNASRTVAHLKHNETLYLEVDNPMLLT